MEEESVGMKGPAFAIWDVFTCPLPTDEAQCVGVVRNIRSAVVSNTPVARHFSIKAIGVSPKIPRPVLNGLHGINLICSIPEIQVRKLIHEMRLRAKGFPAPASYLVISGDKALSSTLMKLRGRNYNILVAHPDGHSDIAESASCVWSFPGILRGEPPYLVRKEMVPPIFTIPQPRVNTFVLWDVRSCPLPMDESKCRSPTEEGKLLDILDNIYAAVFANCSCTDVTITAVGLDEQTPIPIMNLLLSDMMIVHTDPETHVGNIIFIMEEWASSNPAPANFLVISGDVALSSVLKKFQSRNYDIFVAHAEVYSADVVATASRVWDFKSLLRGEAPYCVRPEPQVVTPCRVKSKKKKRKY